MRVKIKEIHPKDAYYNDRDRILGKIIDAKTVPCPSNDGWFKTDEIFNVAGFGRCYFYKFKYEPVEEPVIHFKCVPPIYTSTYEYDFSKPEKKSWIQKIRGYDVLERQVQAFYDLSGKNKSLYEREARARKLAEYMRDRYKKVFLEAIHIIDKQKSLVVEKSRELALMEKVADLWQEKLIKKNEEIMEIGRRLKFSVEHNNVEIIVGNPTTVCKVSMPSKLGNNIDFYSVEICKPTDKYDYRIGAIKSLENLCKERRIKKEVRKVLFEKLFKKYPELKNEMPRM